MLLSVPTTWMSSIDVVWLLNDSRGTWLVNRQQKGGPWNLFVNSPVAIRRIPWVMGYPGAYRWKINRGGTSLTSQWLLNPGCLRSFGNEFRNTQLNRTLKFFGPPSGNSLFLSEDHDTDSLDKNQREPWASVPHSNQPQHMQLWSQYQFCFTRPPGTWLFLDAARQRLQQEKNCGA